MPLFSWPVKTAAMMNCVALVSVMRKILVGGKGVGGMHYFNHLHKTIPQIHHHLQRILLPPPLLHPASHNPLHNHIQPRTRPSPLNLRNTRKPREENSCSVRGRFNRFVEVQCGFHERRVVGHVVAADGADGELVDDAVDGFEGVGEGGWLGGEGVEGFADVGDEEGDA